MLSPRKGSRRVRRKNPIKRVVETWVYQRDSSLKRERDDQTSVLAERLGPKSFIKRKKKKKFRPFGGIHSPGVSRGETRKEEIQNLEKGVLA